MGRLIDADAAVKRLQEECEECMLTKEQREAYCSECGVTEAIRIIEGEPTVKAEGTHEAGEASA